MLPKFSPESTSTPQLTVMTYNVLGHNTHFDRIIATIRAEGADVIGLQELTPSLADTLQRHLLPEYPYQILAPQQGVCGIGTLSRYPITLNDDRLEGNWCGEPQILTMTVAHLPVTLIHFHAIAFPASLRAGHWIEALAREREQQADQIRHVAAMSPHPVVVFGDLNATDQSVAYALLTQQLTDAWRVAGWGGGHTFPGADSPGSSRPRFMGMVVPKWLVRIDFILYSQHWQAIRSWLGQWDGYSDHKPVVTRLGYTSANETREK